MGFGELLGGFVSDEDKAEATAKTIKNALKKIAKQVDHKNVMIEIHPVNKEYDFKATVYKVFADKPIERIDDITILDIIRYGNQDEE
jgi:hypothetical protein